MDALKRVLQLIRTQAMRLTPTQKLLIGSLCVVLLMTMFVVSQYAGRAEHVELMPGATPEQQQQAISFLQANHIEHSIQEGRPQVPPDRRYYVLAQLGEKGALPDDTSILFGNLAEKTSWTMSQTQVRQISNIALQNELAAVIGHFSGVRSSQVFIDAPEQGGGIGRAARTPTATAVVFTTNRQPLDQETVDAIAHLVAGSKAGLTPTAVRVIDGATRRQHRARGEEDFAAADYMQTVKKVEEYTQSKLLEALQHIQGVVVAVNAQVDVTRRVQSSERVLQPGDGTVTAPVRESTQTSERIGAASGGEPGVRSNVGLSVATTNSGRSTDRETRSETELETIPGRQTMQTVDPRGMPTKINAAIHVPRSYFIRLWRVKQGPDQADAEPQETDLTPIVEEETRKIEASVTPLIETRVDDALVAGSVVVSMVLDLAPMQFHAGAGGGSGGGGLGGMASTLASGWIKTVALGALAALSLAMMALTLRKAGKPVQLPSAQELVGVPPALTSDNDMMGEADEAEAALAGIEMTDDDLQLRKKVEQVTTLVKEKPSDAARLLGRWIGSEG